MMELLFFVEEASAKALLEKLLPRIFPNVGNLHFIVFEGKQDMEKQLLRKLRGWQKPNCHFIVLRDKDAGDCRIIKAQLQTLCSNANHPEALIRIACHELESWYLGDLNAVERALNISGVAKKQSGRKFRSPDDLANPVQELKRLAPTYQKIAGSRAIGQIMGLEGNKSRSFNVFLKGIDRLLNSGVATL